MGQLRGEVLGRNLEGSRDPCRALQSLPEPQRFVEMQKVVSGWRHQQQSGNSTLAPVVQDADSFGQQRAFLHYFSQPNFAHSLIWLLGSEFPHDLACPASYGLTIQQKGINVDFGAELRDARVVHSIG